MKSTLLTPVTLLLNFIVFAGVLVIPVVLTIGTVSQVVGIGGPLLFIAWIGAVVVTTLRSVVIPIVPTIFIPIIFVVTSLGLFGIVILDEVVLQPRAGDAAFDRPFPTGTFLRGPERSVYVEDAQGVSLSGIVVVTPRENPAIREYDSGVWRNDRSEIVVIGPSSPDPVSLSEIAAVQWRQTPLSIRGIVVDARSVYTLLRERFHTGLSLEFILMIASFSILLAMIWTPARITRWPLLNALFVFAYVRGVVALPNGVEKLAEFVSLPPGLPVFVENNLLVVVMALASLLFILVALVLPPMREWRREVFRDGGTS